MSEMLFPGLAPEVREFLRSAIVSEFATVSAAGVPIDTPAFCFLDPEGGSVDIATGLAYPAKAERARRNPKVGLLVEGGPNEPVVSISAHAVVRDADIQRNLDRYIAETVAYLESFSGGHPWAVVRETVWYWARIFVCCVPQRIDWWPSPAALDDTPLRWEAPAATRYPTSDPPPRAAKSPAPDWGARPWRESATKALSMPAHLTVLDAAGFPMALRARAVRGSESGFELEMPRGSPWAYEGTASLCFVGMFTFIGTVTGPVEALRFTVERMLPILPTVADPGELWKPSETTQLAFQARLERELARRGQPMPRVPIDPPAPTSGSVLRAARMARLTIDGGARQSGAE